MSDDPTAGIRFYWSFRSPYAWLATERIEEELGDLDVPIERIGIWPTPGLFPNDPVDTPGKNAYIGQDVRRLTRERGLALRFPEKTDTDWARPHAAFLGAKREGAAHAFMLAVFRKRFGEGRDVAEDEVLAEAAAEAGLAPDAILAAADDAALQAEASAGWKLGMERDQIFGVPSFVYAGKLYWGQDRMRFLRSAVLRKSGRAG